MRVLLASFLLALSAEAPGLRVQDEGATKGYADTINCTGAGVTCSVAGRKATVNVAGGGGAGSTPGGVSGNLQANDGVSGFAAYAGTSCAYALKTLDASGAASCTAAPTIPTDLSAEPFITKTASANLSNEFALGTLAAGLLLNTPTTGVPTIYGGTSCAYAVASLNASGAASCQAAPTIPADISAAHYVTTQAEAGLSAEAVLPTCVGTDKLTFDGASISCATDQTSAGGGYATVADEASSLTQRATLNFTGAGVSCVDNAGATRTDCTIAGGSGAPTTATYIVQTADGTLTNEQALSPLSTGLLKVANGTGVLSTAVAGTDYVAPASGCVTLGTATLGSSAVTVGPVTWTGTYANTLVEYEVTGYSGSAVGRVLVGAASISTSALTNGTSGYEGVAGTLTNSLSIPGAPLAVTVSAIGRAGMFKMRGRSGALKRYEIYGQNGNASVSAASTVYHAVGNFSDLGTNLPIQRAQLTVYATLATTTPAATTFNSGTTITVIGCP